MWGGCYIDIHMWFTSRWSRTTSTKAKCQEATLFLLQSIGWHGQGGRWCIGRRRSRFMQKISNAAGRARFTNRILGTILTRRWRMQWYCRLRRIVCATAANKRFWGRGMHWWVDGRLILLEGKIEIEDEENTILNKGKLNLKFAVKLELLRRHSVYTIWNIISFTFNKRVGVACPFPLYTKNLKSTLEFIFKYRFFLSLMFKLKQKNYFMNNIQYRMKIWLVFVLVL